MQHNVDFSLHNISSCSNCRIIIMKTFRIELVACHRKPERSFFFRGKQFPLCARCTGIYIGYISVLFFAIMRTSLPALWSAALLLPALVDGSTQACGWRESNNALRLITGVLFGVGVSSLIAILAQITSKIIKTI